MFINFTYQYSGAVIYCLSNEIYNLSIIKCIFKECKSQDHGGALYISCQNSIFLINMICGYQCNTNIYDSSGQLGYFLTNKSFYFFQSSIIKCPYGSNTRSPIYILNGFHDFNSCNFSNNLGRATIGPNHYLPSIINSKYINIESSSANFVIFYSWGGIINFSYLNFIKNSCSSHGLFFINNNGKCIIKYGIFLENTYLLFYAGVGSSINISNSYILHYDSTKSGSIYYISSQNLFISTKKLNFSLFSTYFCSVLLPLTIIKTKNNYLYVSHYLLLFFNSLLDIF